MFIKENVTRIVINPILTRRSLVTSATHGVRLWTQIALLISKSGTTWHKQMWSMTRHLLLVDVVYFLIDNYAFFKCYQALNPYWAWDWWIIALVLLFVFLLEFCQQIPSKTLDPFHKNMMPIDSPMGKSIDKMPALTHILLADDSIPRVCSTILVQHHYSCCIRNLLVFYGNCIATQ